MLADVIRVQLVVGRKAGEHAVLVPRAVGEGGRAEVPAYLAALGMDLVLVVQAIDGHEQLVIRAPLQYAMSADTPIERIQGDGVDLLWHEAMRIAGKQREIGGDPVSSESLVGGRTALLH